MRQAFSFIAAFLGAVLVATSAGATPSTTFWAPSTPALQPYRVLHVTYDNYFNQRAEYPNDVGLEFGVLPSRAFQMEVGFDLVYPTLASGKPVTTPVLLNAKVGAPEDTYFPGSPGWSAGIFGVGFKKDVTDYNVLHFMAGKTLPGVGSLSLGAYYGLNVDLMKSSDGEEKRSGLMAGWSSPAIDVPVIDHINLVWDIQTGKNVFGATGGGVAIYFTPSISLLTGPVYFIDDNLQPGGARTLWSVQLDIDIQL